MTNEQFEFLTGQLGSLTEKIDRTDLKLEALRSEIQTVAEGVVRNGERLDDLSGKVDVLDKRLAYTDTKSEYLIKRLGMVEDKLSKVG
jgi:chaperonin cofactor prefoldin